MKRTLFLGENGGDLPFTDPSPNLIRDIFLKKGELFKEAAAEALWNRRGFHLFLNELPLGVDLIDTLIWLDQQAPPDALLLFPLEKLHPSALPASGRWIPVVRQGKAPLLQYFLLLDMEPHIQGVAIDCGFQKSEMALFLDPFIEKKGAFSLLNLKKEMPLSALATMI